MAVGQAMGRPANGWTYEDLCALPDDGKRYELADGELYELPPPNLKHQRTLTRLVALVLPEVQHLGGEWYPSSTGVFLPGGRMVEPDLIFLLPGGSWSRSERGIEGAPDLVVEILSPGNLEHDLVRKRQWYAEAGVPEYWQADPGTEAIEVLALREGVYVRHVLASGDEIVTSTVLPGLSFRAAEVFQ